ncbi:MAG: ATP-binding protein [Nanoarchaeota archaeon]|nr:ATP-binding protein [Nanoarchaeota archaeon]
MEKSIISQIIIEQKKIFEKPMKIIKRVFSKSIFKTPKIIVITGVRRCGKSTLLKEISHNYPHFGYVNFEDERFLDFTYRDFNNLLESFLEIDSKINTFFFDEIQNIKGWEKFVRRLFTEGYKVFVTGSNASLLSSEIATSLTGRNLKIELFPFSFKEFLKYVDFPIKKIYTTKEKAIISKHLKDYFTFGGFPEVIESRNKEEINEIYQDIIIKDLLVRLKIRDIKDFRELALYLLSNISKKISYNNLKNLLEFSNTSKVKNYVDFLSEAYIFFTINKYDASLKKQIVNNRKIYAIDTGIINTVAFQFSKNKGMLMENMVFLELRRKYKDLYYFEEKNECDFIIKKGISIIKAIQVTDNLNAENQKREIGGLLKAMNKFKLKEGLIITSDNEKIIMIDNKKIKIVPLWKWLLD